MDLSQPINIPKLVIYLAHEISQAYDNDTLCHQYAWWTLQSITNKTREQLVLQEIITLNSSQQSTLKGWLHKLITERMPIQYLIGFIPFYDLEIIVKPPTLIPRPETEEWTINLINELQKLKNKKLTILDLATGSGCIALALAKGLPESSVYATDISPEALELAQSNAKHNKINNITFIESDLFNNIPDIKFDLIVTNPPYISLEEYKELDTSVTKWEDMQALLAPDHGLAIIKDIIKQAPQYLKPNTELQEQNIPRLVIEIGYKQANDVEQLMRNAGFVKVHVIQDLQGKDRVVAGSL